MPSERWQHSLSDISSAIVDQFGSGTGDRCLLVGISGIDGAGKGYVASRLASSLQNSDLNIAVLNADAWLNLPHIRFSEIEPGRHFYENALRLDAMFEDVLFPMKRNRKVDVVIDLVEETANHYRAQRYQFRDIDVVLVEGIYLFKKAYTRRFDLKIWVECSFKTALSRAVVRSQEGLSPEDTIKAYESIYFPAQRHHFRVDRPAEAADMIFLNDETDRVRKAQIQKRR